MKCKVCGKEFFTEYGPAVCPDCLGYAPKENIKYFNYDISDNEVLQFIEKFVTHSCHTSNDLEMLRELFCSGYCWHFAHLLKTTFNRGVVVWAAPFGHFCFQDEDGRCYDIEGLYEGEAFYMIPESYLGEALNDFKHTNVTHRTSRDEVLDIVKIYCNTTNTRYDSRLENYI